MNSITIFPENINQEKLIQDLMKALNVRYIQSDTKKTSEAITEFEKIEFPKLHKSDKQLPESISIGEFIERHKNTIMSEEFAENIEKKWLN